MRPTTTIPERRDERLAGVDPSILHYMQINDVADTQAWTKLLPARRAAADDLLRALPGAYPFRSKCPTGPREHDAERYAGARRRRRASGLNGAKRSGGPVVGRFRCRDDGSNHSPDVGST